MPFPQRRKIKERIILRKGGGKVKRIFAVLCAVVLTLSLGISTFAVTLDYQGQEIKVGSLHNLNADVKYSWLNKLVLRDDATSVTTVRTVPHAAYPYSRTYEEFIKDITECMDLHSYDTDTVAGTYEQVIDLLYYAAVALGMTDDMNTMLSTIQKKGVRVPANMTAQDKLEAAVIYAALKYNLVYALYGNETKITKGRSIEGASVDILASAMNMNLPSGVDSVEGLALYCCQAYAESFDGIPMSSNPSEEEIFYLMKMLASNKAGYSVPVVEYNNATDIQKQYIDCTYYATILNTVYDITVDPLLLAQAASTNDVLDIARLVLETMLDEKNIDYPSNEPVENLFKTACENGCFDMEEEFYSDVFNYDLYVDKACEKLWVTPFALASQIGGDNKFLTVKVGSKEMKADSTSFFPLDPKKPTENMTITVNYDDESGNSDMSVYVFNIIKQEGKKTTSDSSIVAEIEDMLNDVVPQDNEKANEIVSGVVSAVDDAVVEGESVLSDEAAMITAGNADNGNGGNTPGNNPEVGTTYSLETTDVTDPTFSDFEYFSQLVGETYGEEKLTSSYDFAGGAKKESDKGIISGVVEVVKENPEVVAAPTGVIAAGAFAGYLFTKKKKANPADETNEENSDEFKEI